MKYKFRIKEKTSQFGFKRYYPQYKRFLFWHYVDANEMDFWLRDYNPDLRPDLDCEYYGLSFRASFKSFEGAKQGLALVKSFKNINTYKTSKNINI